MAISCGKLTSGIIGYDCENPWVKGISPELIIINFDEIDRENSIVTADNVIKKIVTKGNAKAYKAELLDNSNSASSTYNPGTYIGTWAQTISGRIFDNTPRVKKFLSDLAKSRVVVLVKYNYIKNNPKVDSGDVKGDTVYVAYGWNVGLKLLGDTSHDTSDTDSMGAWMFTVGTTDDSQESVPPMSIFDTDLTQTEAMVSSLTETQTP